MNEPRGILAVTFDVGGTLIEPWPSVGHIYAVVAAEFGMPGISPEELTRGFVEAWKARRDFDYSRAAWRDLVEQSFAGRAPRAPGEDCFNAIYERFAQADAWRVFEDVLPTLEALKARGLKLAAVSNWDERLRPLLGVLALDRFFDVLTISCEAGWTKPAPQIFQNCAAQLGLPPEVILHVGDSAKEDVDGAHAAGLQGVLLDRGTTTNGTGVMSGLAEVLNFA